MGQNGCGYKRHLPLALAGLKLLDDEGSYALPEPTESIEDRLTRIEGKLDQVIAHVEGRSVHVPGIGYGRLL